MFAVDAVEVTVIVIADLHCRDGGGDTRADHLLGKGKLLLQNVLLWGNAHLLLKQVADRGLRTGGMCCQIVQQDLLAQVLIYVGEELG